VVKGQFLAQIDRVSSKSTCNRRRHSSSRIRRCSPGPLRFCALSPIAVRQKGDCRADRTTRSSWSSRTKHGPRPDKANIASVTADLNHCHIRVAVSGRVGRGGRKGTKRQARVPRIVVITTMKPTTVELQWPRTICQGDLALQCRRGVPVTAVFRDNTRKDRQRARCSDQQPDDPEHGHRVTCARRSRTLTRAMFPERIVNVRDAGRRVESRSSCPPRRYLSGRRATMCYWSMPTTSVSVRQDHRGAGDGKNTAYSPGSGGRHGGPPWHGPAGSDGAKIRVPRARSPGRRRAFRIENSARRERKRQVSAEAEPIHRWMSGTCRCAYHDISRLFIIEAGRHVVADGRPECSWLVACGIGDLLLTGWRLSDDPKCRLLPRRPVPR